MCLPRPSATRVSVPARAIPVSRGQSDCKIRCRASRSDCTELGGNARNQLCSPATSAQDEPGKRRCRCDWISIYLENGESTSHLPLHLQSIDNSASSHRGSSHGRSGGTPAAADSFRHRHARHRRILRVRLTRSILGRRRGLECEIREVEQEAERIHASGRKT